MGEPIRILNVVGRMDRGGIETLIMNIYRKIDRSQVQFDFLAHYGKENADYNKEIKELGGRIFEMPVIKSINKTYYSKIFIYRKALIDFFSKHPEFHIIHGHMTNTAAIYMPIAKKYGKASCLIAHSHLTKTQKTISPLSAIGTDILRKPIRKYATDYFSCSDMAARWLFKKDDINRGYVTIIRNGIDSKIFSFSKEKCMLMRKNLNISEKEVVIGHVGRFYPQKNHTFLLDIYNQYHRINPNSVLLLAGDGELRKKIEQKSDLLGLKNCIRFLGVRNDIPDLMQAMDLFLMPSLYEGLPLVGIEAQASGLPLLVSTEITNELDITGNVSFLNLKDTPEMWAKEIHKIITIFNRQPTDKKILESGYDIIKTVEFLQEFYIKKHFNT